MTRGLIVCVVCTVDRDEGHQVLKIILLGDLIKLKRVVAGVSILVCG